MLRLTARNGSCTLCLWSDDPQAKTAFDPPEPTRIRMWLRGFLHDDQAMSVLRQAAFDYGDLRVHGPFDDRVLIEHLAYLIEMGRVRVDLEGAEHEQGGASGGGGGAPPPPPPPPPPPTPPAPRPAPAPAPAPAPEKGNLHVEVVDDKAAFITEEVEIQASGPESLQTKTKAGSHLWSAVTPGTYTVKVTTAKDWFETEVETTSSTPVTAGGTGEARLVFKPIVNVVTPKIEVEYKVVLLDRGLSAHQPGGEDKIVADHVTYIQVSASQSTGKPPYAGAGGTFEASPANVEVFKDEACQQAQSGPIPAADLFAGPVKLYLRAKTAGKFTAKLTMGASGDGRVQVQGPATEEMGVVELKMVVHEHDIPTLQGDSLNPDTEPPSKYHDDLVAKKLPDPIALGDDKKINPGRLVHVQKDGHHSRAKVVVSKLDAGQWPGGTDDYLITLAGAGKGGLAVHGKEVDAAALAPASFKVSALKAAEQVVWVEGSAIGETLRDTRLELGLDRPGGGLAHKPKGKGDFACFGVLQIAELALSYTKAGDEHQEWDEAQKRWYINLNRKGDPAGRKVKFKARLHAKLAGVPLRFMLAPDKDNTKAANWNIDFPSDGKSGTTDVKWKDVPEALKHLDKTNRQRLLHLKGTTDANGEAEVELQLSRWGGDKFHPAVYLEQDPHLCKYVHGHAELGKREPHFAKVTPVQVWRKVFYQVTRPKDTAMAAMGGFDTSQRKVFLEPLSLSERSMQASDFTTDPYRAAWQYKAGGNDDLKLCIGTHNVTQANALFVAEAKDTTPKFHLIVCDEQFDADVQSDFVSFDFDAANPAARDVTLTSTSTPARKLTFIDPPLQGGALVIRAWWQQMTFNAGAWSTGATQNLPAANVKVQKSRAAKNQVNLTPPAAGVIDATHTVRVWLELKAANGPWAGWAPSGGVPSSVVKASPTASAMQDVTAHEMGHLFAQTRVDSLAGLPDHKFYYQKRGGSGSHCAFGATFTADATAPALDPTKAGEKDAQGNGAGSYASGTCIMFGIASAGKVEWCKHCALDLIAHDMSKFR